MAVKLENWSSLETICPTRRTLCNGTPTELALEVDAAPQLSGWKMVVYLHPQAIIFCYTQWASLSIEAGALFSMTLKRQHSVWSSTIRKAWHLNMLDKWDVLKVCQQTCVPADIRWVQQPTCTAADLHDSRRAQRPTFATAAVHGAWRPTI